MVSEPKHKSFKGPIKKAEPVLKINIKRHMSIARAFE
jgi:hypothetical protein